MYFFILHRCSIVLDSQGVVDAFKYKKTDRAVYHFATSKFNRSTFLNYIKLINRRISTLLSCEMLDHVVGWLVLAIVRLSDIRARHE